MAGQTWMRAPERWVLTCRTTLARRFRSEGSTYPLLQAEASAKERSNEKEFRIFSNIIRHTVNAAASQGMPVSSAAVKSTIKVAP